MRQGLPGLHNFCLVLETLGARFESLCWLPDSKQPFEKLNMLMFIGMTPFRVLGTGVEMSHWTPLFPDGAIEVKYTHFIVLCWGYSVHSFSWYQERKHIIPIWKLKLNLKKDVQVGVCCSTLRQRLVIQAAFSGRYQKLLKPEKVPSFLFWAHYILLRSRLSLTGWSCVDQ